MAGFKLVWQPETEEEVRIFFEKEFGPLLEKHLIQEMERTSIPHSMNIQAFMDGWRQKAVVLIMAYEGEKAVGFLVGYIFAPIFTMTQTCLNVERWFINDDTAMEKQRIEKDMLDYLKQCSQILGINHVSIALYEGRELPVDIKTVDKDSCRIVRLA